MIVPFTVVFISALNLVFTNDYPVCTLIMMGRNNEVRRCPYSFVYTPRKIKQGTVVRSEGNIVFINGMVVTTAPVTPITLAVIVKNVRLEVSILFSIMT
jgi:hypothetical protein